MDIKKKPAASGQERATRGTGILWEATRKDGTKLQLVLRKDRNPYIGLTEDGKLVMCAVISKFEACLACMLVEVLALDCCRILVPRHAACGLAHVVARCCALLCNFADGW